MTGSALIDFIIALVVLGGAVGLFVAVIDGISPDLLLTKISKIAVGVAAAVAVLLAIKSVLGWGGGVFNVSPLGIFLFAIGIIVVLVVMYLVKLFLPRIVPEPWVGPILYVISALVLIALLGWACFAIFGVNPLAVGGGTPSRPFLR